MTEIDEIERDLTESRASLKNNVDALSEKLTLGRIVDDLLSDSKIDWSRLGDKAGHSMKSALPGAVIGAGVAMLVANGGISALQKAGGVSRKSQHHDEFDPVDDWRADSQLRAIEGFESTAPRLPEEDPDTFHSRRLRHHAEVLGHTRLEHEDDQTFHERVSGAVDKLKASAAGARDRLKTATKDGATTLREGLDDAKAGLKSAASSIGYGATAASNIAKDSVHDGVAQLQALFQKNPAIALAMGLGVGALLGAVVPISEFEENALSKPVKRATIAAADFANQISEKIGDKVGSESDSAQHGIHDATA